MKYLLHVVFVVMMITLTGKAFAVPKDGFCQSFQLSDIPVGQFKTNAFPESPLRITQKYNNSKSEGYCSIGGLQPDANSPQCAGQQIYYGHDGLDLHPQGAAPGVTNVVAAQSGLVVASHPNRAFSGWGESIIIAARANLYSEEILTFHYHHLFVDKDIPTRLFGPCDKVVAGVVIAKEGGTPNWPSHLHFGVRRWASLRELQDKIKNNPNGFYGSGYSYGDDSKLQNYLNPQGLLLDTFFEFAEKQTDYPSWQWAQQYARQMRSQGWEFGLFAGGFGVDQPVKRREAVRWIKQAMRLASVTPVQAHFYDVPLKDPDSPYVEALLTPPMAIGVINPKHSCASYGLYFCPDQSLTRAEALKMIIAGFYQDEFLDIYTNWVWQTAAPLANNILSQFSDVSPYEWYAPYVYFAVQKGMTAGGAVFNPNQPIRRAELAKWLVVGAQHRFGDVSSANTCHVSNCPIGQYCDQVKKYCQNVPTCLPLENNGCPLGGGYVVGSTGSSGSYDAGVSSVPDSSVPSGVCLAGQDQLALCPSGQAGSYRVCLSNNQWSEWNPPCFTSGGNLDSGVASGSDAGVSSPSDSGADSSFSGVDSGSSTSTPDSGSTPTPPPPACTVAYHLSPAGASCYSNPSASGAPTLCLETQSPVGASVRWRLCKQSSTFQNAFTYQLLDQNHLSHYLTGAMGGSTGTSCTSWQQSDFSYINQNGPVNGAGLLIEVHSPSGCTSSACTYRTGITTIYRDCL